MLVLLASLLPFGDFHRLKGRMVTASHLGDLEVLIVCLGGEWSIRDVCLSHGEEHARGLIVDQADSIDHVLLQHLLLLARAETTRTVPGRVQTLHSILEQNCLLDQWVGPLAPVDAIGKIPQVVLLLLVLGDTFLVGHIAAHFNEFSTKHEVFMVDFGILELVLGDGETARLVVSDARWFFLDSGRSGTCC